jgi:hypothetical protein
VLKSSEFQNATPYNKAFYDTMFMVKDFWATPEYAEVLDQPTRTSIRSWWAARAPHRKPSTRPSRTDGDLHEIRPPLVSRRSRPGKSDLPGLEQ